MAETKVTRDEIKQNDTSWQTLSLTNGWVVYDADSDYGSARYRKDETGTVYLNLMIKSGTVTTDTVVGTLPVGYRPVVRTIFTAISNNAIARMDINTSGQVLTNSGVNAAWVALTVSFKVA